MVVSKVGAVFGRVLKASISPRILSTSVQPVAPLSQKPCNCFTPSCVSLPLNGVLSRRFISKKSDKDAMKSPGAAGSSAKDGMKSPGAAPSSEASGSNRKTVNRFDLERENAKLDEWQMEAVEGDRKWQQQAPNRGPGYTGKDANKKTNRKSESEES